MLEQFSVNQLFGMLESARTLDIIDNATRDHIPQPTDSKKLPGQRKKLKDLLAEHHIATRYLRAEEAGKALYVMLSRNFSQRPAQQFGAVWPGLLQDQSHSPFRNLEVVSGGFVIVGRTPENSEQEYAGYRIQQPNSLLHNLGIIVVRTITQASEIVPIEGGTKQQLKKYARQLFQHAAHSSERAQAEASEQLAHQIVLHTTIERRTYTPDANRHILGGAEAQKLGKTILQGLKLSEEQ